jgi:hypothetical protein
MPLHKKAETDTWTRKAIELNVPGAGACIARRRVALAGRRRIGRAREAIGGELWMVVEDVKRARNERRSKPSTGVKYTGCICTLHIAHDRFPNRIREWPE